MQEYFKTKFVLNVLTFYQIPCNRSVKILNHFQLLGRSVQLIHHLALVGKSYETFGPNNAVQSILKVHLYFHVYFMPLRFDANSLQFPYYRSMNMSTIP